MNPDQPSREQIETRITALLLGELPADEAALLRYTISQDPALKKLHDQIESSLPLVREAAQKTGEAPVEKPAPMKLSTERRAKLLAHFKTARPKQEQPAPKNPLFWLKRIRLSSTETLVAGAFIVLAIIGITAISIPNFVKARATSHANAVVNNMRQIDAAKMQWALENHKTAGDTPTANDLSPYLKNGAVNSVMGETYVLGKISEPVSADVDASAVNGDLAALAAKSPRYETISQRVRISLDEESGSEHALAVNTTAETAIAAPAAVSALKSSSENIPADNGAHYSYGEESHIPAPPPSTDTSLIARREEAEAQLKEMEKTPAVQPAPAATPPPPQIVLPAEQPEAGQLAYDNGTRAAGNFSFGLQTKGGPMSADQIAGHVIAPKNSQVYSQNIAGYVNVAGSSALSARTQPTLAVTVPPEPQLAPPPDTPPSQIVLPQTEPESELGRQGGAPANTPNHEYTQNVVGYVNIPQGSAAPTASLPTDTDKLAIQTADSEAVMRQPDAITMREKRLLEANKVPNSGTVNGVVANFDTSPGNTGGGGGGGFGGGGFGGGGFGGVNSFGGTDKKSNGSEDHNGWVFNSDRSTGLPPAQNPPQAAPGQTLGVPATTTFAFDDADLDGSRAKNLAFGPPATTPANANPMGAFPGVTAPTAASEAASETTKSESPERKFQSAVTTRGTGVTEGNRFYRTPTTESDEKKVPMVGDIPVMGRLFQSSTAASTPPPAQPVAPPADTFAIDGGIQQQKTEALQQQAADALQRMVTAGQTQQLPSVATQDSEPSDEKQKLIVATRKQQIAEYQASHKNTGFFTPSATETNLAWNGPLDQPEATHEPNNHFISRYAYIAQPSAGLPALVSTNYMAINGFNPGVSAITPEVHYDLSPQGQTAAPSSDTETLTVDGALQRYGELTGRNILHGALPPSGDITLPKGLSKEDETTALQAALAMNAVSMVNVGDKFAKALPSDQAGSAGGEIDRSDLNATAPTPTYDAVQLQTIHSQMVESEKVYKEQLAQLQKLKSIQQTDPTKLRDVLPQVVPDNKLNELLAQSHEIRQEMVTATNDYRSRGNDSRGQHKMDELNYEINDRITGIMASLDSQVETKKASLDAMASKVEAAKQQDQQDAIKNQPYYAAKIDLEQKKKMHELLYSKLEAENLDLGLPKTSMVQITDPAEPAHNQTFWQKLTGQYESTARIKVENDVTDIPSLSLNSGQNAAPAYDPYFIQTTFEIMQSEPVLGMVVDALNLQTNWAKNNGGEKLNRNQAIEMLKQRLELQPVKNTKLIAISAKSSDKDEAAKIANAVADAYRQYRIESRLAMTTNGVASLEQQFEDQAHDLQLAQAKVEELGKKANPESAATPTPQQDLPLRQPAPNTPIPQPEILTSSNAFSTFAMNVSDVSFKLAEASLQNGKLPDTASIRSEEFINAFDYRDLEAAAGQPMAFTSERALYPFAHNRELLRFSVKTAAAGRQEGRPLNLVLLLDTSGSMERADRVEIVREALRVLSSQLHANDIVSVVSFARTARLWADGVSGDKAGETLDQVGSITPEGGTNLEEAMRLAYETARRHYLANGMNRVVLLTDGAANLGNVDPSALKAKVETQRKQGIALDCFGIGWEDFNDDLLEELSSNGDGRYAFLNAPEDATKDFAAKLAGALQVAAQDLKVQVEFNPQRVTAYRQIGYAKHQLTKEQFRDNTVAAGEIAAQEAGNALYTIDVKPDGEGPIATVHVRYRLPGTQDYREHSWEVEYTGHATALDLSSPAMRLAATASAFSEWLAASPYAQEVTPDKLLRYLSGVPEVYGADDRPKQLETMIREAKSLEGK